MLLNDKIGRAHELYQLYNQYPEELLFEVFTNMKNAGIITKVKKVCTGTMIYTFVAIAEVEIISRFYIALYILQNAVNTPITMGTYQLAQRYDIPKCML